LKPGCGFEFWPGLQSGAAAATGAKNAPRVIAARSATTAFFVLLIVHPLSRAGTRILQLRAEFVKSLTSWPQFAVHARVSHEYRLGQARQQLGVDGEVAGACAPLGHANPAFTLACYGRDPRDEQTMEADVLARAAAAGTGG
jgi:hypothetical protein